MPASLSVRATILTPRSLPSRPTLAIKTRSFRTCCFRLFVRPDGCLTMSHLSLEYWNGGVMEYWSIAEFRSDPNHHSNTPLLHYSGFPSQTHRFAIFSVNSAKHFADFPNGGLRPYRFHDRRHEIAVGFSDSRKLTESGSCLL